MNTFFEVLNHPIALRIGWVLLHSLWQGALVGVVFGLCRFALRKHSSNVRYLAGCLALTALMALSLLTFLRDPVPMSGNKINSPVLQTSGESASAFGGGGGVAITSFGSGTESFVRLSADFLSQVVPWLATIWLGGVLICSVRLIRSCCWVKTLRTTNNEPVDAALMEILNDLRRRLGISRPVRLLKSALVEVPTVMGWLRPVILMPAASLAGLTPQQMEAILAHELAHLRRLDHLVNVFQCLVETLMFYHPVVWWISRVVRDEREHCCDDLVIKVCGNRLAYARALVSLEAFRGEMPEFTFAASGGSLTNRIRRLFGMSTENKLSNRAQLGGLALLGIGLVLTVLGVYLMLTPKYRAEARIRVEPDVSHSDTRQDQSSASSYNPYFIPTELEIIRSQPVLAKVIDKLDLRAGWGKKYGDGTPLNVDDTVRLLGKKMELRPVRNTSLIDIVIYDDDPAEAAQIANSIAEVYADRLVDERRQRTVGNLKVFEVAIKNQEAKVRQIHSELDQLRKELRIADIDAQGTAPSPSIDSQTFREFEKLRIESENRSAFIEKLLSQLRPLSNEELREVLPAIQHEIRHDSSLSNLLSQLNIAEQKLVTMQSDYSAEHPERVSAKNLVDTLNAQINKRVDGIMASLKSEAASAKTRAEHIKETMNNAKVLDIEKAERSRPYYEKKRELESLLRFSQILTLKMEAEKIDMNLPRTSGIIVNEAVPSRSSLVGKR